MIRGSFSFVSFRAYSAGSRRFLMCVPLRSSGWWLVGTLLFVALLPSQSSPSQALSFETCDAPLRDGCPPSKCTYSASGNCVTEPGDGCEPLK